MTDYSHLYWYTHWYTTSYLGVVIVLLFGILIGEEDFVVNILFNFIDNIS